MKALVVGVVSTLFIIVMLIPAADAVVAGAHETNGAAAVDKPFKYVYAARVNGKQVTTTYEIYLDKLNISRTSPKSSSADLKLYINGAFWSLDKNVKIGPYKNFQGGKLKFYLEKFEPSRCLPRTNNCSEDAVLLSVV